MPFGFMNNVQEDESFVEEDGTFWKVVDLP